MSTKIATGRSMPVHETSPSYLLGFTNVHITVFLQFIVQFFLLVLFCLCLLFQLVFFSLPLGFGPLPNVESLQAMGEVRVTSHGPSGALEARASSWAPGDSSTMCGRKGRPLCKRC